MKKLTLLIIVIVALLLLLPYLLGFEIENRYRGILAQFEDAGYELESHEYDRGFYRSQARSVISVPVQTPQGSTASVGVMLVSDIVHGPYTTSLQWIGHIAEFDTVLYQQDKPLFPDALQAQIHTVIEFSGNGRTDLNIPALEKPLEIDQRLFLEFSGLEGLVDFNVIEGEITIDMQSDGLGITSPGQGKLVIGNIQVQSQSMRGIAGLMLGTGNFAIANVGLTDSQRDIQLEVEDISINANTFAVKNNINMLASYSVGKVIAGQQTYGPAVVEVELTAISAEALATIQENISELKSQPIAPQQQGMAMMGVVMSVLPALLEQSPAMALKKLEFNTPQGKVEANFSLKAEDMTVDDMDAADKLLAKLSGEAFIQIPEVLARQLMANNMRQNVQLALSNSEKTMQPHEVDELVSNQVNAQLDGLIGQRLIERKGSSLVSVARLKAGILTINGQTLALPPLQ